jgi:hypothetical protein
MSNLRQVFAGDDLEKIADSALERVKHFTIGFARAGEMPAAKGSGVLVKYGGMKGILTCAHVDSYLRTLTQPVGLVRLNRGLASQFGVLDMNEVDTYASGEDPWPAGSEDIAFIWLPPHLTGNVEKDCVFVDFDQNLTKPQPDDWASLIQVHSIFGLVEEFTGATTRQGNRATTNLTAVLTAGTLLEIDALNFTLECFKENLDLPQSFGGTSGGGLWRVYVRKHEDENFAAVHHRLIGIASREEKSAPPRIICQGPGRIEAMLKSVRKR